MADEGERRLHHGAHLVDVGLDGLAQRGGCRLDAKGDAGQWRAQVMGDGADHRGAFGHGLGDARLHLGERFGGLAQFGRAFGRHGRGGIVGADALGGIGEAPDGGGQLPGKQIGERQGDKHRQHERHDELTLIAGDQRARRGFDDRPATVVAAHGGKDGIVELGLAKAERHAGGCAVAKGEIALVGAIDQRDVRHRLAELRRQRCRQPGITAQVTAGSGWGGGRRDAQQWVGRRPVGAAFGSDQCAGDVVHGKEIEPRTRHGPGQRHADHRRGEQAERHHQKRLRQDRHPSEPGEDAMGCASGACHAATGGTCHAATGRAERR